MVESWSIEHVFDKLHRVKQGGTAALSRKEMCKLIFCMIRVGLIHDAMCLCKESKFTYDEMKIVIGHMDKVTLQNPEMLMVEYSYLNRPSLFPCDGRSYQEWTDTIHNHQKMITMDKSSCFSFFSDQYPKQIHILPIFAFRANDSDLKGKFLILLFFNASQKYAKHFPNACNAGVELATCVAIAGNLRDYFEVRRDTRELERSHGGAMWITFAHEKDKHTKICSKMRRMSEVKHMPTYTTIFLNRRSLTWNYGLCWNTNAASTHIQSMERGRQQRMTKRR